MSEKLDQLIKRVEALEAPSKAEFRLARTEQLAEPADLERGKDRPKRGVR